MPKIAETIQNIYYNIFVDIGNNKDDRKYDVSTTAHIIVMSLFVVRKRGETEKQLIVMHTRTQNTI